MSRYRFLLLLVASLLVGCGVPTVSPGTTSGGSAAPAAAGCPDAPGPINGPIVFGADNNLFSMQADGSGATSLITAGEMQRAYDPMWSPDGNTLAFTLSTPSTVKNLEWLPVGVICGLDKATGKGRVLAHGASSTTSLEEPTWTPDGQALMLAMHQPKLDPNNTYVADIVSVVRYNLADGNIQRLMQDGTSPQLAPDGQRLAYLHRDPQTVMPTLMLAQPDGQNSQPIALQASSGGSVMLSISTSPRWSPDSRQIALAVSGATAGASPERSSGRTLVDRLLGVGIARAHGAPSDIWLINPDGQALNRVTRKNLDDPRVAWSPDGQRIAYTSTLPSGVFVIDLTTMQEQQLSKQGDAGGITWAKH